LKEWDRSERYIKERYIKERYDERFVKNVCKDRHNQKRYFIKRCIKER
jgi:hypothetical protein